MLSAPTGTQAEVLQQKLTLIFWRIDKSAGTALISVFLCVLSGQNVLLLLFLFPAEGPLWRVPCFLLSLRSSAASVVKRDLFWCWFR